MNWCSTARTQFGPAQLRAFTYIADRLFHDFLGILEFDQPEWQKNAAQLFHPEAAVSFACDATYITCPPLFRDQRKVSWESVDDAIDALNGVGWLIAYNSIWTSTNVSDVIARLHVPNGFTWQGCTRRSCSEWFLDCVEEALRHGLDLAGEDRTDHDPRDCIHCSVPYIDWRSLDSMLRAEFAALDRQANRRADLPGQQHLFDDPPELQYVTEQAAPDSQVALKSDSPNAVDRRSPTHAPDFASVNWYGTVFEFTKSQAACVRVLWEAMENRAPTVGQEAILELAEVDQQELRKVFRDHPAWGTMIASPSKGRYRLQRPDEIAAGGK